MQEYDNVIPVRGPSHFFANDKEYCFVADGGLESFSGKEEISFGGKIVYHCLIYGGFIK